jgi:hypothetical protein
VTPVPRRRRTVRGLPAILCLLLLAPACSAGADRPQGQGGAARPATTGPATPGGSATTPTAPGGGPGVSAAAANPLGLKWNWAQRATFGFAEETRGGATFFETDWCDIQPGPDAPRNWDRVDSVVERSAAMGYELLLKIRAGECQATAGGPVAGLRDQFENRRKTPSALPRDLDAYRDYVREFVSRYSARGVHLYAVENEVDVANFWSGSYEDYATVVRTAAEVIRATDPEATVLDAGISSTSYGVAIAAELLDAGREEEALAFYSDFYRRRQDGDASRFPRAGDVAGLRQVLESPPARRSRAAFDATFALARSGAFDVYQLHYYEPWPLLPQVLDWVRANLPDGMPIEAWEAGVAWPGSSYSPEAQGVETGKLLGTLLAAGVSRVVYLPLAFTPESGRQEVFRGLVEPSGAELPAAAAYRSVAQASTGARGASAVASEGVSGVAFDHGDSTALLLWAERLVELAGVEVGAEPVVVSVPAPVDDALAQVDAAARPS